MSGERTTVPGRSLPQRAGGGFATALRGRLHDWGAAAAGSRVDIAVVVSITMLGALLRLWGLGTVPLGLHGDEAWTGIDARRLLNDGWISPYVESALGQPTGPVYFTAILFKVFPQTTFTLRASIALFGVATIPAAYLAYSTMFNRTVGAFAALILAVMTWHLQLSRTAFMVTAWPFMEMMTLWVLWLALGERRLWLFVIAGALWGAGLYTYNAYLLFLPVPLVALAWSVGCAWRSPRFRDAIVQSSAFVAAGVLAALPLLVYIGGHERIYREHQQVISLTNSAPWQDAGFGGKAELLWDRAEEWGRGLVAGGRPDLGDGLATDGHPVVDPFVVALALVGVGIAAWNWRRRENATLLAAVFILPLGAIVTVGDGLFRRTLGLAPFVAVLAAVPLARLWELVCQQEGSRRLVLMAAIVAALGFVGARATYDYFGPTQDTFTMRFVYPYQMDAASHYIDRLPQGTYVYFLSDRWSFDYETRRYLAPNASGEDRSREFPYGRDFDAPISFDIRPNASVAFVFLGLYVEDVNEAIRRYPGGELTEERRGDEVLFRGYYVSR